MEKIYFNKTKTLIQLRDYQLEVVRKMDLINNHLESLTRKNELDFDDVEKAALLTEESLELYRLGQFLDELYKKINAL